MPVANLRRGADGRVSLSAGAGIAPPEREAATLPQLIGQIDEVLAAPALAQRARRELAHQGLHERSPTTLHGRHNSNKY